MATKKVDVQGKAGFSHLNRPDTKFDVHGKWSVQLYPNQESLNVILELKKKGLKNDLNKNDDNETYINFSCPVQKTMRDGTIKAFPKPVVTDKDGKIFEGLMGHGSDITCTLEVYDHPTPVKTQRGLAARLYAVRIDHLVPFEIKRDGDDNMKAAAEHLEKVPQPTF